ncbi:MAG: (d)CMP kinase [Desulfobacterales bacterium]
MMNPKLLITIDGPAGSGKTTVSRILAERLSYLYVDTGALYRGIALAAQRAGISPEDETALKSLCQTIRLCFVRNEKGLSLLLNGEDVSERIRTPEISMKASAVSAISVVRDFLLRVQRDMGAKKGAVFEGRDMGTVVFPDADVKFFLYADLKVRAARRYAELKDSIKITPDAVEKDMEKRDRNDSSRKIAPLRPAEDAICIDTSLPSVSQVVEQMLTCISERLFQIK